MALLIHLSDLIFHLPSLVIPSTIHLLRPIFYPAGGLARVRASPLKNRGAVPLCRLGLVLRWPVSIQPVALLRLDQLIAIAVHVPLL